MVKVACSWNIYFVQILIWASRSFQVSFSDLRSMDWLWSWPKLYMIAYIAKVKAYMCISCIAFFFSVLQLVSSLNDNNNNYLKSSIAFLTILMFKLILKCSKRYWIYLMHIYIYAMWRVQYLWSVVQTENVVIFFYYQSLFLLFNNFFGRSWNLHLFIHLFNKYLLDFCYVVFLTPASTIVM